MGFQRRVSLTSTALRGRLAIVCFSRSFGGLEMTAVRLSTLLAGRGADVSLIAPHYSPIHDAARGKAVPFIPLEPAVKYGDVGCAIRLSRAFRKYSIDAALFLRSQDIHLGALAATFGAGTRLVFYQQMQSGIRKKDFFHRYVFSRLSAWLTLTEIMKREVLHWTTMTGDRVHVAYLGRDEVRFKPSPVQRRAARKALRLAEKDFVVGVLGRLDRQKGQIEFIRSYPGVRKKVRNPVFLIAGDETKNDPGMRSELEGLRESLGITDGVRILPPSDDVPGFLSALDVFAMPSYSETYGLVLLEAMAMGLPVVSTTSGGVPELVRNGIEGILVEPKNIDELTTALTVLGTDASQRRKLGRNGRQRFLSTFRESVCTDRLVDILQPLLQ